MGVSRRRRWSFVGGLAFCLVAGWFLAGRPTDQPPAPVAAGEPPVEEPAAIAPTAAPSFPPAARPRLPPPEEDIVTTDGLPIAPPRGDVTSPAHPHPITPQHQRIYAENRLIGALDGAMEVRDVAGMRELLEQYRREYPEDDNQVQDGYAVIADCFQHPGGAAHDAAARWLDAYNGSTLKRFVNRHCLGVE